MWWGYWRIGEMTDKEIALKIISDEIKRDINVLIEKSRQTSLFDLECLIYLIFMNKAVMMKKIDGINKILCFMQEEAYKYLAQLLIKYGRKAYPCDVDTGELIFDPNDLEKMISVGNRLNSKYDTLAVIKLLDVEVSDVKNKKHIKFSYEKLKNNYDFNALLNYAHRIYAHNMNRKNSLYASQEYIDAFEKEFLPYEDIFCNEFGVEFSVYIGFLKSLLSHIQRTIDEKQQIIFEGSNGTINLRDSKIFYQIRPLFRFKLNELISICGKESKKVVERLVFGANKLDEFELAYHLVSRTPIIRVGKEDFLICPNLLLDSLFVNTHYSLLEGCEKEKYKKKTAGVFVEKISELASKYGFNEVCRELELFDGKNSIGDLDIVFKNSSNQFLIIEAKNHALPLKVYFNDKDSILEHLKYLKREWEAKVLRRHQHIKENNLVYGIGNEYIYIIVSRYPEIISHYSEIAVLSLYEFEQWIATKDRKNEFSEIYSNIYKDDEKEDMDNVLEKLRSNNLLVF